ncbi:MAG: adenosylcobinamide-phosphate synthase CbiB [Hyphomicrobiaceae bacterium]
MSLLDLTTLPGLGQRALILLAAIALDAAIGDPDWLWDRVKHPVVHIGNLIGWGDRTLNKGSPSQRRWTGWAAIIGLITAFAGLAAALSAILGTNVLGLAIETLLVAILLAGRSLYDHVKAVADALKNEGLPAARSAVSRIVGRDPEQLDESGIARGAIESTAENFADGVVAPAFWFLVAGLPGIVAYKVINTADSMIGHRTDRHKDFGYAAARIDDFANLLPARLSGLYIAAGAAIAGYSLSDSLRTMWRDARKHASPNAGRPETAMAGALGIALAGPRRYAEYTSTDPWLNDTGRKDTNADDIFSALAIMRNASIVQWIVIALIAVIALPV